MKRSVYAILFVVFVFALQACGGKEAVPQPGAQNPNTASIPDGVYSNEPVDQSLVGSALNSNQSAASCPLDTTSTATFRAQVIALVNNQRTGRGLPALTSRYELNVAAQRHAQDMGCNFFCGHEGSDGSTPDIRLARAGYVYSWWGENVGYGFTTAQDMMTWWMNSPTHRANILNENFTEIGIGYVYNTNDTVNGWYAYWVMDLGAPGQ